MAGVPAQWQATINSFDYSYDRVGNRKTKVDQNGTASYTYDTLNRLIEAINPLPTNPLETYTYDSVGNRTTSNQNGASVFNAANQLLEDIAFTYQYDANGNQTRKTNKTTGEFTTFEYTAENQLVLVVRGDTGVINRYDGLGRRVEKEMSKQGQILAFAIRSDSTSLFHRLTLESRSIFSLILALSWLT